MILVKFKSGVKLARLQAQMAMALPVIASVYEKCGAKECVVTSVNDGKHSTKSKHYTGEAIDTRIWEFPTDERQARLVEQLQLALNGCRGNSTGDFDVVLESTHIHIEYDPK